MIIIIFFFAHHYFSLFSQTFFHHRYAAHKQFTMSRGWEKFFYIYSWFTQGSSYLSPYAYAIMHRMHHAHADTELDPHSPKYDNNVFSMMMRTKKIYYNIFTKQADIDPKFTKDVPEWQSFDKFGDSWLSRLSWGTFYVLFYFFCITVFELPGTHWAMYFLLPIHFVMGPVHGAIINWFAHKYGYTNHKLEDTSKNLFPLEVIMWGEGLHNNHHTYPARANFANKWWEFDLAYPVIRIMNLLGIIKLRKSQV